LLRQLIEGWGYPCAEAEDGATALDYASTHDIALIVTDLEMPRLDGIGLVRALRELQQQRGCTPVPVILVTGSAPNGIQTAADAMDIIAVLPKPMEMLGLQMTLRRVLPRTDENKSLHGRGI
jgi:two-component system chemotaxis response regulator CheY